jgi:hypothetical protein
LDLRTIGSILSKDEHLIAARSGGERRTGGWDVLGGFAFLQDQVLCLHEAKPAVNDLLAL